MERWCVDHGERFPRIDDGVPGVPCARALPDLRLAPSSHRCLKRTQIAQRSINRSLATLSRTDERRANTEESRKSVCAPHGAEPSRVTRTIGIRVRMGVKRAQCHAEALGGEVAGSRGHLEGSNDAPPNRGAVRSGYRTWREQY